MTKNFALLRKTMEHIEAHPQEWDQQTWITKADCGTVACFAGWAVLLAHPEAEAVYGVPCSCGACDRVAATANAVRLGGRKASIEDVARDALGLTCKEGMRLFGAGNGMDDLRDIVAGYLAEENNG
jgi:hypothetical protein